MRIFGDPVGNGADQRDPITLRRNTEHHTLSQILREVATAECERHYVRAARPSLRARGSGAAAGGAAFLIYELETLSLFAGAGNQQKQLR
ncbi:hypothetical protein EVAR_103967_1 [Eumeta japonica]|uniref:Uncharacterized protein n=1 Tax=Eumeta variegata TaxID=151549 RepID=A0A4C1YH71_EUMVA|nr:hypothetical protein EVAR_103967_1 [Eumeta japonica]